jgi:hypothetical protein
MFRLAINFKKLSLPAISLVKRFAHETPNYKRIPRPPYEGHAGRNTIIGFFVMVIGTYTVFNIEDDGFDIEDQDLLAAILQARTNGPQSTPEEAEKALRDVFEEQKIKRANKKLEAHSKASKSTDEKEK